MSIRVFNTVNNYSYILSNIFFCFIVLPNIFNERFIIGDEQTSTTNYPLN